MAMDVRLWVVLVVVAMERRVCRARGGYAV